MQLRRRPLRPLPARPDADLPRRPGLPLRRDRAADGGAGAVSASREAEARGLEVRVVRRLPAHAARLRGRAARARRARSRSPTSSRRRSATVDGPVRRLARRGLDHDRARRRADPARSASSRGCWSRSAPAPPPAASRRCATSPTSTSSSRSSTHARSTSRRSRPRRRSPTTSTVDFELRGCPIDEARSCSRCSRAFLHGRRPNMPVDSVCIECKRARHACVMVAHGTPCLGPVTHAGCGAICPAYDRGCYGCFGPMETPEHGGARRSSWRALGHERRRVVRASSARSTRTRPSSGRRAASDELSAHDDDPHRLPRPRRGRGRHARARSATARSSEVQLKIYEPPRFFEALLRGRAVHRGARHHRAHLRHLPGRLPDRARATRWRTPAASSVARAGRGAAPASLLRRVDREPRAAHLHAPRAGLPRLRERGRAGRDHRDLVERGAAAEEGRQRDDAASSAAARSTRSTCASAASTARPRAPSWRRSSRELERARDVALETVALGGRASTSPTSSRTTSSSPSPSRASTPIERGRDRLAARGLDIAVSEYEQHFVEEHVERSNALHSHARRRGSYLVGPLARYALNRDRLSPLAARGAPTSAGLGPVERNPFRSIVVRAVETRLRRRRGAAAHRRVRAARPAVRRGRAPRPARATAAPRRRAASAATATSSTPRARSSTRRSCRRPRRTRRTIEEDLRGVVERSLDLADDAARAPVRADDPQLRPVHLLRDPLPRSWRSSAREGRGLPRQRWRGDDGVGLDVADACAQRPPCSTAAMSRLALVDAWDGRGARRARRRRLVRRGAGHDRTASTRATSRCRPRSSGGVDARVLGRRCGRARAARSAGCRAASSSYGDRGRRLRHGRAHAPRSRRRARRVAATVQELLADAREALMEDLVRKIDRRRRRRGRRARHPHPRPARRALALHAGALPRALRRRGTRHGRRGRRRRGRARRPTRPRRGAGRRARERRRRGRLTTRRPSLEPRLGAQEGVVAVDARRPDLGASVRSTARLPVSTPNPIVTWSEIWKTTLARAPGLIGQPASTSGRSRWYGASWTPSGWAAGVIDDVERDLRPCKRHGLGLARASPAQRDEGRRPRASPGQRRPR